MPNNKIKEIAAYQAKIAALEKSIAIEQKQKLTSLHNEVGFKSTEDLIDALRGLKKAPGKVRTKAARKGKRTRITSEIKAEVASAVEAGMKGAEIAAKLGISIPSIQNIKKELGLVKKRGAIAATKKVVKKAAKKITKKASKK